MTGKTFQFEFGDLNLTVDQIERVLGYREGESHETIFQIISRLLLEAEKLSDFRAEYRIFDEISFNEAGKILIVNGIPFNIGRIIFGQIKRSGSVALFACTAGSRIGDMSRKAMKEQDLLEGYIYDVIGSEAVEAVADLMQNEIETEMAASGKGISNRFSPGYCGWDVSEQHKLFNLIAYNYCGIRLTESALMDPIKSLSGLIGIGENVRRMPNTCSFCDMKNCTYRRKA